MGVNPYSWRSKRQGDSPCAPDCQRRSATCHADCPDYAEFAEAKKAEYEKRAQRIQSTRVPKSYNSNQIR